MRHFVTKSQESKKHPAFILGIDASYFKNQLVMTADSKMVSAFADPINPFPFELFLDTVQSYLVIREREYLDESTTTCPTRQDVNGQPKKGDPSIKQLLPYQVVFQIQPDGTKLYFPYRRTKQVGESRLAGNGSIGYGGHIDLVDMVHEKSVINLRETILLSLFREANEEFLITGMDHETGEIKPVYLDEDDIHFPGLFIVDNSNAVGELHLGLIVEIEIPTGFNIRTAEDELAFMPPMTLQEMLDSKDFKPENWTEIYLNYIKDHEYALGEGPEVETDESGLERELTDSESEEDITGSGQTVKDAVLEAIDAEQDRLATTDTPYPPLSTEQADAIAQHVTGDPTATFAAITEGN